MNFALILFCLLLASGAICADLRVQKRRAPDAKDPWWVEYGASFFPVILLGLRVAHLLPELFKIPFWFDDSDPADWRFHPGFHKFTYGIRLPVINKKIISINEPKRGDVMSSAILKTLRWITSNACRYSG